MSTDHPTHSELLIPGDEIGLVVVTSTTGGTAVRKIHVHYYEELNDEQAAEIAAEIIAHQLDGKSDDETMVAAVGFQQKLVAALTARAPQADNPNLEAAGSEPGDYEQEGITDGNTTRTATDAAGEDQSPDADRATGGSGNDDPHTNQGNRPPPARASE